MELTIELKEAISKACSLAGGRSAFANKMGVKHQNISRYLNGQVKDITPKILAKLWVHICQFMPKDSGFDSTFAAETNAELLAEGNEKQSKYATFKFMHLSLDKMGADTLFLNIMMYWNGMDDEQKKEAYKQFYLITENTKSKTKKD